MTIVLSVLLVLCLMAIAHLLRGWHFDYQRAEELVDELDQHFWKLQESKAEVSALSDQMAQLTDEKNRLVAAGNAACVARDEALRRIDALEIDLSAKIGALSLIQQREKSLLRRMAMIRSMSTVVCSKCMLDVCNCDAPKILDPGSRPVDKIGPVGEFYQIAKSVLDAAGIPEDSPTPAFPPSTQTVSTTP